MHERSRRLLIIPPLFCIVLGTFVCMVYQRIFVPTSRIMTDINRSSLHTSLNIQCILFSGPNTLIDFGLSNVFYGDSSLITQCGSPAYAAPEIFSNQKYGPAVDIWSVGVCLYAMLVGALPFIPDSPNNLSQLHSLLLKGCEIPDGLSEECADLVTRMLHADDRKRIKMDVLMHHPWLLDSHDQPVPKYPTLSQIVPQVPQSSVMNYMTKMFNFDESDIIYSLHERKVNSIAATYHLIHKRFEAGLHLIGSGMEPITPPKKSHTFATFPLSFSGKDASIPRSNGYVKNSVDKGLDYQDFQPASYKNYLQYLKDSKNKPLILSKQGENVIIRRKGPRVAVSQQYRTNNTKNTDKQHPVSDFMLTCHPKHEVYEWSSDGVVSYNTPEIPKHIQVIKKTVGERLLNNLQVDGNNVGETPPPPPNTSLGGRAKTEIEINNISINEKEPTTVPKTSPNLPRPGSLKTPYRYSLRTLTEPRQPEEYDINSNYLNDPFPEELWGMTGKSRQRLVRGAALTLSRSKTIYANSISSQKLLTPREAFPSLDDIRQTKVVGRGRLLLDRSTTKVISSGITDYTKPKTAGLVRQRFPEMSAALSRAKSDLGIYEKNSTKSTPEPFEQIDNQKPQSPVEQIIAEDEAPMMRIRITTCPKS